ncbi:putative multidrug resistance protein NorM [Rhodovastum atsumiense]|uniref:Multidrug transporter n=2 Tax=Rhodovastum atsumiense TaxID=504468 RepID=A0A5M6IQU3_9PROT|nr:multidrug transporter [Rhodovastum atsumiense]CAH2600738.1 putative multidrug resistance protein NorM [Rhodovastum atsumiense]
MRDPGAPMAGVAPRFVTGPTMHHVVVMAGTGAIGLVAVFAVDLVNLFYISRLGDRAIAAAVGFAGVVGFFQISLTIGLAIGASATVSRALGAGAVAEARHLASVSTLLSVILCAVIGLGTVALLGPILDLLGASGETRRLATSFLTISAPSLPLMGVGMCLSGVLRSAGDPRRAMNTTLLAAVATAAVDPVLIFGLGLGLEGAAISLVISRLILAGAAWHGVARRHGLLGKVVPGRLGSDLRAILGVALPAMATNIATPVGAAYVTYSMATFGPEAVAGLATIDRISPVAFGLVYALSGAVGPILAQNHGAHRPDRVRRTLRDSLVFALAAVCGAWVVLALGQGLIVRAFSAEGITAELVRLFCSVLAFSFMFTGSLFVANAAFNNLGHPLLSTLFNWGRATLGTIPFVTLGARFGPEGVLVGQALGSVAFGIAAVIVAFRVLPRPEVAEPRPGHTLCFPGGTGVVALAAMAVRPLRRWEHRSGNG